jgi:hypothetical protein
MNLELKMYRSGILLIRRSSFDILINFNRIFGDGSFQENSEFLLRGFPEHDCGPESLGHHPNQVIHHLCRLPVVFLS